MLAGKNSVVWKGAQVGHWSRGHSSVKANLLAVEKSTPEPTTKGYVWAISDTPESTGTV